MADFGWAFVRDNLVTGSTPPSGAVQFNDGSGKFGASGDLVFISGSTSQLNLTGTLNVSGAINANRLNITVTEQNVVNYHQLDLQNLEIRQTIFISLLVL